ncbi:MAG: hypothetical protein BroJett040_10090 [Oligoflexia bacterium]|nr:MAG: hypothetical protein BroJett040_10090 [Oligoflexia bacterium]
MKDIKNYERWMTAACEYLTPTEFKVWVAWYGDAPGFSAGATRICERVPGLRTNHARAAIRNIAKKKFIKDSGAKRKNEHGSPTTVYVLGSLDEVIAHNKSVPIESGQLSEDSGRTSITKRPDTPIKEADDKEDSGRVAVLVQRNKEETGEEQLRQNTSPSFSESPQAPEGLSQKKEKIFHPLGDEDAHLRPFGDIGQMQHELDQSFLRDTNHIRLGSLKKDELEKVVADLESTLSMRHLFNEWGDSCGELYPSEQVKNLVIQKILENRFRDKSGVFSIGSELYFKVEATLKSALWQRQYVSHAPKRACSPEVWKRLTRLRPILDAKNQIEVAKTDEFISEILTDEEKQLAEIELTDSDTQLLREYGHLIDRPFLASQNS